MATESDKLMAASLAAISSAAGVSELWKLREQLEEEGRSIAVHACSDLIVRCSIDHRVDLDRAESLARELVEDLPDRPHLLLLAGVLESLGKNEEAAKNRALASQAKDLHPQPPEEEARRAMEETLAAEASGKKPLLD